MKKPTAKRRKSPSLLDTVQRPDLPPSDNRRLHGLVEWVMAQGGTVKQFNEHILLGRVRGIRYRYFVTERWAGVLLGSTARAIECLTTEAFIKTIESAKLSEEDKQWVS